MHHMLVSAVTLSQIFPFLIFVTVTRQVLIILRIKETRPGNIKLFSQGCKAKQVAKNLNPGNMILDSILRTVLLINFDTG